jgi:hypothetical protein
MGRFAARRVGGWPRARMRVLSYLWGSANVGASDGGNSSCSVIRPTHGAASRGLCALLQSE